MKKVRVSSGERGASILELAMITPLLAVVVMGVVDLTRAHQLQIRLESAAREGAAFAQLRPNDVDCSSDDDVAEYAGAEDDELEGEPGYSVWVWAENGAGELVVPVTGCGGTSAQSGERVRVEVVAQFAVITPLVSNLVGESITLTGSAEVEVQG